LLKVVNATRNLMLWIREGQTTTLHSNQIKSMPHNFMLLVSPFTLQGPMVKAGAFCKNTEVLF